MANTGSARFTRRWTNEQIDAYLEAVLLEGQDQAAAMRAAMAGTLKTGLAPFGHLSKRGKLVFGYDIVKRHSDAFVDRNPRADAIDTEALLRKAHQANKRALRDLATDADPAERVRLMKAVAEGEKTLPRTHGEPKPKASPREPEKHGAEPDGTLGELVALANTTHSTDTKTETEDRARGPVRSVAR